jgi:hypothetical protein
VLYDAQGRELVRANRAGFVANGPAFVVAPRASARIETVDCVASLEIPERGDEEDEELCSRLTLFNPL